MLSPKYLYYLLRKHHRITLHVGVVAYILFLIPTSYFLKNDSNDTVKRKNKNNTNEKYCLFNGPTTKMSEEPVCSNVYS
uniref:Uncharacterized protein n=1 Tax=Octopus bimaculoides TaxID=37653 RepID=A0A0L8IF19_OCTBM